MITIDVKSALIYLLLVGLIVFVIYLTVMAKNLIQTVKSLNEVLKDTETVTKIASDRIVQFDGVADDVQSAVSDVANAIKGQQNLIGTVSNIIKSFGSIAAICKNANEEAKKKTK